MKNGSCIKCENKNVFCGQAKYERVTFHASWLSGAKINTYICIDCGYLEEYVDLETIKQLDSIQENFERVLPLKN